MKIFLLALFFAMGSVPTNVSEPTKISGQDPAISGQDKIKVVPVESIPTNEADRILYYAIKYCYVWEDKGPNRSKDIDIWNKFTGAAMGSPYCASYVSYMHYLAGVSGPKSAWSPDTTATKNIKFSDVKGGDTFGLYFSSKGRIAHTGLIEKTKGSLTYTVEGNTSPDAASGSSADRDGGVVCKKTRATSLMANSKNKFSRYWK